MVGLERIFIFYLFLPFCYSVLFSTEWTEMSYIWNQFPLVPSVDAPWINHTHPSFGLIPRCNFQNSQQPSYYFIAQNWRNFQIGTSTRFLPNNSNITGIQTSLRASTSSYWNKLKLETFRFYNVGSGNFVGTNRTVIAWSAPSDWYPGIDYDNPDPFYTIFGGPNDNWELGSLLTPNQFRNTSNWGIGIRAWTSWGGGGYVNLFELKMTIYYNFNVGVGDVSPKAETGTGGGKTIFIYGTEGTYFLPISTNVKCRINGIEGQVTGISAPTVQPSYIVCVTPPQSAPGSYVVSISLDGNIWTTETSVIYSYFPISATCNPPCVNGECNNFGQCVCNNGWTGQSCNQAVCDIYSNCNFPNGNCIAPDTCLCSFGWSGLSCDQVTCPNDCNGHGTCITLFLIQLKISR